MPPNDFLQPLVGWQFGAQLRNHYPCDRCRIDRRTCELDEGAPCARCRDKDRPCTVNGFTQKQYYNALVSEDSRRTPQIFERPDGDGYLALLTQNRHFGLQRVTLHFVKLDPIIYVTAQEALDAITNSHLNDRPFLREMLNRLYDNSFSY